MFKDLATQRRRDDLRALSMRLARRRVRLALSELRAALESLADAFGLPVVLALLIATLALCAEWHVARLLAELRA